MVIGAHVSIAGGLTNAIKKAKEIGSEAIQIFITPPQTFKTKNYTEEDVNNFNLNLKKSYLKKIVFHSIYLLNLASEKEYLVKLSEDSLIYYLNFGSKINSIGTIFHIGSTHQKIIDFKNNIFYKQIVLSIKKILNSTPENQFLIIENVAGGGGKVGATLDELEFFYKQVDSKRLKFCIDTQHLFASGIDVSNFDIFEDWLKNFDKKIGIENLLCIHLNDSKSSLGSFVDRHENIGEGKIGKEGFQQILRQPLLQSKMFILEVPGFDGKGPDKENLERVKKYIKI